MVDWWGYTSAADKQRLEATVRHAIRLGLYTADDLTPSQLAADMDDNLSANLLNNPCHVLYINYFQTTLNMLTISDLGVTLSLTVKTNCYNNTLINVIDKNEKQQWSQNRPPAELH